MNQNHLKRELFAEFLGTMTLIAFGAGVVSQVLLSGEKNGVYLSINLAWGFAVTMGIYIAGGVSGAHLNPAVTFSLAIRKQFPWSKFLPYSLAQTAGAFTGAAIAFLVYREAFDAFDGGFRQISGPKGTAGIFATYPQPYLSTLGALIDQIIGTALLMMVISAIGDARNNKTGNLGPIVVGFLVMVIGMAFGLNAGYAINPARDFGPRLFTALAGWSFDVFRVNNFYFWVPIVGPLIGGPIGAWIYDVMIGNRFSETAE